ncbi:Type II secretory pathway, pullulanase PulA [Loktanella sp. 3ANDIMAR09]|uniref:sulfotransferase family 2 domain-containing protein n=1 Tax=Loktanella sp. 3ANDIMAR09 TaxID=1225657 RepID=UPI0006F7B4FB|nr:sulfotransferase family 2 domain-containing protein [Loktanella sp. 3ANDIMAR09]KQI68061.1 Type II secretory pathway, pullulanase PulA [Loktanella sp. 3ANDIMAR09]
MIISRARKFVFVHIPKTGGTSFAHAYDARAAKDDILIGDTPKARNRRHRLAELDVPGRLWKHSRIADVGPLIAPEGMCIMVLVRNPWARMVSYYHWLRRQSFDHPAVRLAATLDFSAFLHHPHTVASLRANPYASYVTNPQGQLLAAHFVRLEHYDRDMAPVAAHLGFALPLPRLNTATHPVDWRTSYTPADADLIADLCAADITRSRYRFDDAA